MKKLRGFSLFEILVSLLIVSAVVLGFYGLQVEIMRAAKAHYYAATAMNQIRNIENRLQLHAQNDSEIWAAWSAENAEVLPGGHAERTANKLIIYWGGEIGGCEHNKIGMSGCLIYNTM